MIGATLGMQPQAMRYHLSAGQRTRPSSRASSPPTVSTSRSRRTPRRTARRRLRWAGAPIPGNACRPSLPPAPSRPGRTRRNLADDLLQHVFDADEAGYRAVLVDQQGHVVTVALHFPQQCVQRLGVRHEHSWPHHPRDGRFAAAVLEQNVCSTRSFRYTTPTMSSTFSPITGIRECPLRTARVIA